MISTIYNKIRFVPIQQGNKLTTERIVRFWDKFAFLKDTPIFDMLLTVAGWLTLLSCGIILGYYAGTSIALYLGEVYSEEFGPVYFSDYVDLNEIVNWIELPHRFAVSGQAIGIFLGPFFILILAKIYSHRYRVEQDNNVKTSDS
jgi:hypothetical protein